MASSASPIEQEPGSASGPDVASYNKLFDRRGLRSFYHNARFRWLAGKLDAIAVPLQIVEFGCCDGRVLDIVDPARIERYVGIDANWGGGLDLARQKFADRANVEFIETTDPAVMREFSDGSFNAAISLETVEHIPAGLVAGLLDEVTRVTDGEIFISVPVEFGPVFLAKYLGKAIYYGDNEDYGLSEIVNATLGRSSRVNRGEHKGFDYRALLDELAKRSTITKVEGLPVPGIPAALSLTVAIAATTRPAPAQR